MPGTDQIRAWLDAALAAQSVFDVLRADTLRVYPVYPRDAFWGAYANTRVPLLMMNGELDAQTPIEGARHFAQAFAAPHQTLVELDRCSHGILSTSLAPGEFDRSRTCGWDLLEQFVAGPTAELDTRGRTQVCPIEFRDYSALANEMFGTRSLYDNGGAARRAAAAEPGLEALLRELRRGAGHDMPRYALSGARV